MPSCCAPCPLSHVLCHIQVVSFQQFCSCDSLRSKLCIEISPVQFMFTGKHALLWFGQQGQAHNINREQIVFSPIRWLQINILPLILNKLPLSMSHFVQMCIILCIHTLIFANKHTPTDLTFLGFFVLCGSSYVSNKTCMQSYRLSKRLYFVYMFCCRCYTLGSQLTCCKERAFQSKKQFFSLL